MTARTKVTLEEAAEIKGFLVKVVYSEFSNEAAASRVVDAFFAEGVIDVDSALRHARADQPAPESA